MVPVGLFHCMLVVRPPLMRRAWCRRLRPTLPPPCVSPPEPPSVEEAERLESSLLEACSVYV